jgi:hypothetical protein
MCLNTFQFNFKRSEGIRDHTLLHMLRIVDRRKGHWSAVRLTVHSRDAINPYKDSFLKV